MSCDCVLIGRLTKDCEQKATNSGKLIYTLSVASNRGFGDKQETDFFDCMAFHPNLEKQYPHLLKGCMVKVVGHFQQRENDKGIRRNTIIIDSLEMLWGKKKNETEPKADPAGDDVDIPF